ncbi:MAG: HEAT repeat domain-containing protein [Polyangia bacterium]|nr:HEAT repeat domain-containing protein [Polyangia bacterium]
MVRVTSIQVKDRTSSSDQMVRFRPSELRAIVTDQLAQQVGFTVEDSPRSRSPSAHRLKVDLELQGLVGTEKGKASVLVSLDLARVGAPADEPGYLGSALGEKVYKVEEPTSLREVYKLLIERALSEVLRGMALEIRLRRAPARLVTHAIRTSRVDELDQGWSGQVEVWQPLGVPGQLSMLGEAGLPGLAATLLLGWTAPTAAGGEGPDVRELAIKIAALRRMKEAVPALLGTLEQERRERIRDLCLGALAEIRDESAVPALTRYSKFGDIERLRKVIGVLGQIGGKEARAFLEMTADSHEDEDLQRLARETLGRLPAQAPRPNPNP